MLQKLGLAPPVPLMYIDKTNTNIPGEFQLKFFFIVYIMIGRGDNFTGSELFQNIFLKFV